MYTETAGESAPPEEQAMPLELFARGIVKNQETGEEKEINILTGLTGLTEETLADAIRWQFERDAEKMGCVPVRFVSELTASTPVGYPKRF